MQLWVLRRNVGKLLSGARARARACHFGLGGLLVCACTDPAASLPDATTGLDAGDAGDAADDAAEAGARPSGEDSGYKDASLDAGRESGTPGPSSAPQADAAIEDTASPDASGGENTGDGGGSSVEDATAPVDGRVPLDSGEPSRDGAADADLWDAALDAGEVIVADSGLPGPTGRRCPAGPYAESPVPTQLTPRTLCTGLTFSEGPVWIAAHGSLYFSDFANGSPSTNYDGSIVKYTEGQGCGVWLANAGSNGLSIGPSGQLVACRHTDQTLTAFDLTTQLPEVLAAEYAESHFSSPNDVAVRADGNVYFSDPAWNLGTRVKELPQAVYRLSALGELSQVEVLDGLRPNGVALSPDGSRLYVALTTQIREYDLDAQGVPSQPREFAAVTSDGLAVDCAGNVYVTSSGVQVFGPNGDPLGSLQIGGNITNLAFGGPDAKTLFITGGTQLRAVDLNIPGLPY